MENILYLTTLRSGETAPEVWVTEEVNAFLVWFTDLCTPNIILHKVDRPTYENRWRLKARSEAIEWAVREADHRRRVIGQDTKATD